jgi:hypothetical protein
MEEGTSPFLTQAHNDVPGLGMIGALEEEPADSVRVQPSDISSEESTS